MAVGMSTTAMNSTADVEKRLKTLRKKLKQIEELKQKSGSLDADAQKKVNSEQDIRNEIAMLESPCPVLESLGLEVSGDLVQKSSQRDFNLLEDIEAALANVPSHAALLLGASEKRFRELQKSLRDLVKLLKMDKPDKLQQQKMQRLSEEAPELLRAFLSIRSAAIELASSCDEAEIKALKAEREATAVQKAAVAAAAAVASKLDVKTAPSPVTPPRIGIDVGGVLNKHLNDANSDEAWEKTTDSEAPGAMQALAKCVKYFGPENTFILSKCSGVMQARTETWLFKTMNICGSSIGMKKKNVHFCTDRHGPNGKGGVAASLELSHFVDDRDDCLWSVFEEGNSKAAVERHSGKFFHMARGAAGRQPPRPKEWSADERSACVTPVRNWSEVLQHLGIN